MKRFKKSLDRATANGRIAGRIRHSRRLGFYQLGILHAILFSLPTANAQTENPWWRFRGPNGSGIASDTCHPPTDFDSPETKKWVQELPGPGASSPIVVGDKVILTCYSGYGLTAEAPGEMNHLKRHLLCFQKQTGDLIWQKDFSSHSPEDPFTGVGLTQHGYASPTPVSDGQRIFVFFGKSGVYALDLEGNELWNKVLGTDSSRLRWGSAASPILCGDILVVNGSDESESVWGLNPETGEELWRHPGIQNTWSTPVVVKHDDSPLLILSIPEKILALNPRTGNLNWFTTNGPIDSNVSASPVVAGDQILFMGSRSRTAVLIQHDNRALGDVTETHTLWTGTTSGKISTPLIKDNYVYYFSEGKAYCQQFSSGRFVFSERLPRPATHAGKKSVSLTNFASPVSADGRIYLLTRSGYCYVTQAKPEFVVQAINLIAEEKPEFNATPAIDGNQIFIRSNRFLYCFGQ